MLSPRTFIPLHFTFKSLLHFVMGVTSTSRFVFVFVCLVCVCDQWMVPPSFVGETLFLPWVDFAPLSNISWMHLHLLGYLFCSSDLLSVHSSVPQYLDLEDLREDVKQDSQSQDFCHSLPGSFWQPSGYLPSRKLTHWVFYRRLSMIRGWRRPLLIHKNSSIYFHPSQGAVLSLVPPLVHGGWLPCSGHVCDTWPAESLGDSSENAHL